jgi:hypothetical protein
LTQDDGVRRTRELEVVDGQDVNTAAA